jgi:hypothetical protein
LKFVLTSRPYRDINRRFQELLSDFPTIKLSADTETPAITAEIDLVVEYRMEEIRAANNLAETTSNAICEKLKSMKGRTYLWLKLILDAIDNSWEASRHRLEDLIDSLPTSVYQSYRRILAERRGGDLEKARRIFHVMLAARRPFRVTEMSMIMALDDKSCRRSETEMDSKHIFCDKIRHICGLLVIIVNDEIFFMHQTVRDFLLAGTKEGQADKGLQELSLPLTLEESHSTLFFACSQVILHEATQRQAQGIAVTHHSRHAGYDQAAIGVEDGLAETSLLECDMNDTLLEHALVDYACRFWMFHAEKCQDSEAQRCQFHSRTSHDYFEDRIAEVCWLTRIWWPHFAGRAIANDPLEWHVVITMAYFGFDGALERYLSRARMVGTSM